jgi:hypothetical protein
MTAPMDAAGVLEAVYESGLRVGAERGEEELKGYSRRATAARSS